MRFRRRSSVFPRAAWPNGLERTEPLKGQLWTRSERALREPDVHWSMRAVAGSEWRPVAAYRAGASPKLVLLSRQAVVLGPAATASGLVVVQGPAGAEPHVGDRPIDVQLLTALVNMQRAMPALIGQDVSS